MVHLKQAVRVRDHKLRVLIVDDSVTMRAMLHMIFSEKAYYELVGVAKGAEEALALVAKTAPDLVVIDLCMPYISGSELLSMLRGYPRVHKVILSSSVNASGAMRQKLIELGAAAFFDKADVAKNPQGFRDDLRRIAKNGEASPISPKPAVGEPSGSNVIFAAGRFPIPPDEQARLRKLAAMDVANLSVDPCLEIIVRHLAEVIDYSMIAINLIDADKVWAKAAIGFERQSFLRAESFCTHALCQGGPLMVSDASTHPIFRNLPSVTGDLQVRAYLGVPIVSKDGVRIGVVCASDSHPRRASKAEITNLTDAAKLIAAFLDDSARRYAA